MVNKSIKVISILILLVLISACSQKNATEEEDLIQTSSQQELPSLHQQIIGLWEYVSDDGTYRTIEFLDDNDYLEDFNHFGTYEFMSEETIAFYRGQNTKIARVIDVSKRQLVLEEESAQTTFTRISAIKDFSSNIKGVWEWSDGAFTEFARSGNFLSNTLYRNGYFTVLSENTIAIYDDEQRSYPMAFFSFSEGKGDSLTAINPKGLMAPAAESSSTLKKLKSFSNLDEDILGVWKNDDGEVSIEFTSSGKAISHLGNEILHYRVISDNTIMVESDSDGIAYFNIVEISNKTLSLRFWDFDQVLFGTIQQFTKLE